MQTLFSLWAERLQNSVQQHPRRVLAGVAVSLSLLGGGAFAVASLDANSTPAPLQQVLESVSTLSLPSLSADKSLQLFRSDVTRSNDTADSLLSRLGVSDSEAATYLRNARTARQQLIGRAGRLVSAEGDAEHRLTRLTARWANDDGENFTRWVMERNAEGFVERQETAPLNSSTRMGNGSIQSSLLQRPMRLTFPTAWPANWLTSLRATSTFTARYARATALRWSTNPSKPMAKCYAQAACCPPSL